MNSTKSEQGNKVKHSDRISLVWPYITGPGNGSELRFSIRSAQRNFVGNVDIWVVGERPDWYEGNFLPIRQVKTPEHTPRFDRAEKLLRILDEPAISEEFVWMMDDIYFVNPITLEQLSVPRSNGCVTKEWLSKWIPTNGWQVEKKITWDELARPWPIVGRLCDSYAACLYENEYSKVISKLRNDEDSLR